MYTWSTKGERAFSRDVKLRWRHSWRTNQSRVGGIKHGAYSEGFQGRRLQFSSCSIYFGHQNTCRPLVLHHLLLRWPHPFAHDGVMGVQPGLQPAEEQGYEPGCAATRAYTKALQSTFQIWSEVTTELKEVKHKFPRGARASHRRVPAHTCGQRGRWQRLKQLQVFDCWTWVRALHLLVLEFSTFNRT